MESCTFMFHVVSLKRNECSQFWGEEQHSMKLKFLFLKILFEWTSASHMFSITDFLEFLLTLLYFNFIFLYSCLGFSFVYFLCTTVAPLPPFF